MFYAVMQDNNGNKSWVCTGNGNDITILFASLEEAKRLSKRMSAAEHRKGVAYAVCEYCADAGRLMEVLASSGV